jgi:hypothetical protein
MSSRVDVKRRSPLRAAGVAAAVVGAVASVGLTVWLGRNNPSVVLMVLFVGWVLGPFAGLLVAHRLSTSWSDLTRVTLHSVMLVIAVASVVVYGDVAVRPRATQAFTFLVLPLCSWLVMVIAVLIAAFISRRHKEDKSL